MIAVIDYGLGNSGSIVNMLKAIGEHAILTNNSELLCAADKLILPGVGAFDAGARNLKDSGLDVLIKNEVNKGKPILGICLGMQLLGRKSEEGELSGLGLLPFDNVRFVFSNCRDDEKKKLKIPHMGWDIVEFNKKSPITNGIENQKNQQRYYFVHSFHAVCDCEKDILMTCNYGYKFTAAISNNNIYGVQFHPEKSHDFGMKILSNFALEC